MEKETLQKETNRWLKDFTDKAKSKVTGNLQQSIDYTVKDGQIAIEMEDYGTFVDLGVNGKNKSNNSPYGYKSKRPPITELASWAKARGISPWAVSNSIYSKGTKAKNFMDKPFLIAFDELAEVINKALSEDIEIDIKKTLK